MILAVTTADSILIHEDKEFAQEVMDSVDVCVEQGLSHGILFNEGDDVGIYGYKEEQLLAMCDAEGLTQEELLAQFLFEKLECDGNRIDVVYLEIGSASS